MRWLAVLLLCSLSLGSNAQTWNCDTLIVVNKTTDHIAIHTYGNVHNLIAQDIDMRWEVFFRNVPSQWEIYLDDPTAPYDTIQSGDAKDFTLSGSVDPQFPEKMIFGMDHGYTPGHGWVDYKIYPVSDPTDTLHMVFDITIVQGTATSLPETAPASEIRWTTDGTVYLADQAQEIALYDLQGRLVWQSQPSGLRLRIPARFLGSYILQARGPESLTRELIYLSGAGR